LKNEDIYLAQKTHSNQRCRAIDRVNANDVATAILQLMLIDVTSLAICIVSS